MSYIIFTYQFGIKTINYYNNQGLSHRDNGPARIIKDNNYNIISSSWYCNGKRHRMDGPAIYGSSVFTTWWYQDKNIDVQSQKEFEKLLKLKTFW